MSRKTKEKKVDSKKSPSVPRQAERYTREIDSVAHQANAALDQLTSRHTIPEDILAVRADAAAFEIGALGLIAAGHRALQVAAEMKGYAEAVSQWERGGEES